MGITSKEIFTQTDSLKWPSDTDQGQIIPSMALTTSAWLFSGENYRAVNVALFNSNKEQSTFFSTPALVNDDDDKKGYYLRSIRIRMGLYLDNSTADAADDFGTSCGTFSFEQPNAKNNDQQITSSVGISADGGLFGGEGTASVGASWSNSTTRTIQDYSLIDQSNAALGILDHQWNLNYDAHADCQAFLNSFEGAHLRSVPSLARSAYPLIEQATWVSIPANATLLWYKAQVDWQLEWTEGTNNFFTYETNTKHINYSTIICKPLNLDV